MADLGPMGMVQDYQQGQVNLQLSQLAAQNQQMALQQRQQQMAAAQQMQQIAANAAGAGGTPVDILNRTGVEALKAGRVNEALDAFKQASTIQDQSMLSADRMAQAKEREMKAASEAIDVGTRYMSAAEDTPQGWAAAKMAYLADNPKPPTELMTVFNQPWRKGIGTEMADRLMNGKDRAKAQYEQARLQQEIAHQQAADRISELRANAEMIRAKAEEARAAAIVKSGGVGGRTSALIEQRQDTLATNALEFTRTLGNVTDLPAESSSGIFGNKTTHSLFTAPAEAAANELTSDSVQRYKTEMGALGNHLAWMISGGLNPTSRTQEKYDDLLQIKQGDTQATILTKLARARQEADNALAVKEKSRLISPEMREMFTQLRAELADSIPFTIADVNKWANAKDRKTTFRDFMGKSGVVKPTAGGVEDVLNQYAPVEK